ncbi:Ribonuclease H-like superfamily [Arabidopsis suecica]|uniref:Ribonuclease H-like superfamily n=1 Tax=Arabidopsis suecica TaxID=45249 RepID=A0A8T2BF09_ARASU|nr:Ribonuclease H-like superfamily [Arabidopsis suecica]
MAPSISTIRNYYTHQEYSVDFFGEELIVTVTRTPSVIRKWINNVHFFNRFTSHPLVVGLGVYWTLPGHYADPPPESYNRPADTLQLCVGTRCIIIQLSHCDHVPYALHNFLASYTHVGVWNSQDAIKLERCRHQLKIGKLLDIRRFVEGSRGSLRGCSFEEIVEECMGYRGVRLDPEVSRSDWSVYDLCEDQILQASIDVYVCFKLGVRARLWEV